MNTETRFTEYDPFAWLYNRHWGEKTLRVFTPILDTLLLRKVSPGAHMLDVCCGTGQLARWLTDKGYRVTGIDGSAAMLRFARENAPEAEFVQEDARAFTLPPIHQAAISTFDSLNHILALDDLAAAFRNVQAALQPGGLFLFDLNTDEGFRQRWSGALDIIEDDHVCITRAFYHAQERLARLDFTLFHLEETWQRTDFTLYQRAYEDADVCQALKDAGFADIQIYDAEHCPEGLPSLPGGRAFFLARKEK